MTKDVPMQGAEASDTPHMCGHLLRQLDEQLGAAREAARAVLDLHHEQALRLVTKHVEHADDRDLLEKLKLPALNDKKAFSGDGVADRALISNGRPLMPDEPHPGDVVVSSPTTSPRGFISGMPQIISKKKSSDRRSKEDIKSEVDGLPGCVTTSQLDHEELDIVPVTNPDGIVRHPRKPGARLLGDEPRSSRKLRQLADVSETAVMSFHDDAHSTSGSDRESPSTLSVPAPKNGLTDAVLAESNGDVHKRAFGTMWQGEAAARRAFGTQWQQARDSGMRRLQSQEVLYPLPIWRTSDQKKKIGPYQGPKLEKILTSFSGMNQPKKRNTVLHRNTVVYKSKSHTLMAQSILQHQDEEDNDLGPRLKFSKSTCRDLSAYETPGCEAWVIHPYSMKRAAWDLSSLALVLWDIIMIPLDIFELEPTTVIVFFTWLTRLFWTVDIPTSCMTGFVMNNGTVVLDIKPIVRRYMVTWFPLDIFIVTIDWIDFVIQDSHSGVGYARVGKASRTFRILRMVRLLRLVRMREVFDVIAERISSETLAIMMDIVKITLLILGMAHITACAWYGLANMEDKTAQTWLKEYGYLDTSFAARYCISMHWSLTQFAGGMDEITPENVTERVFAMLIFIIAFVVAAVFVSSITSSMTQLNIIGSHRSQQLSVLRRYLSQCKIASKLSIRVQRNAAHAMNEQQRVMPESSVELLALVSEPLRSELHFAMYKPILEQHLFFSHYIKECPQVMRKVCHFACNILLVSAGDVIFTTGEIPAEPKMYVVCSGHLQYTHDEGDQTLVEKGHFITEPCLWTTWMHRGVLISTSDCKLCALDAQKFQDISGQFTHSHFNPKIYAGAFVDALNSLSTHTDLPLAVSTDMNGYTHIAGKRIDDEL